MKCPTCKDHTLLITERQGIEIDYCPECRGVWLDRGELDKLLSKSRLEEPEIRREQPPQHPTTHHPQNSHPGHYQKPYKRKKSLLEALFD